MDDAAPPPRVRLRPARKPRWLLLNGGTLLFLCLFLPALENCGEPLYPIELAPAPELWPLLLPYLFGLAAAAVAIQGLFFAGSTLRRWNIIAIVFGFLCYGGATLLYTVGMVGDPGVTAIPFVICVLLLRPALHGLRKGVVLPWQAARAIWIGGTACSVHFGLFVVMDLIEGSEGDRVLYGMWLSLAASIALVVAGGMLEGRVEAPPREPPPLPPARVAGG